MINPRRVSRGAPVRDAILRLADGSRTAAQIGAALGRSQNCIRAHAHKLGIAHMLRPASGVPIVARLPPEVVLRDLRLPHDVSLWLIAQMRGGVLIQGVLSRIVTDGPDPPRAQRGKWPAWWFTAHTVSIGGPAEEAFSSKRSSVEKPLFPWAFLMFFLIVRRAKSANLRYPVFLMICIATPLRDASGGVLM
jgi:hypothetical protein